jgi:hypothetical protein
MKALVHKIGLNCGKQVRKETVSNFDVTCPKCIKLLALKNKSEDIVTEPILYNDMPPNFKGYLHMLMNPIDARDQHPITFEQLDTE